MRKSLSYKVLLSVLALTAINYAYLQIQQQVQHMITTM